MINNNFSQHTLIQVGTLSTDDINKINLCRGRHNKLGYAYQLIFIKLLNYLPKIKPLEIIDEVLTYTALQLSISDEEIQNYKQNVTKLSAHRNDIIKYLALQPYSENKQHQLQMFVFNEALRLESVNLLKTQAIKFLKTNKILSPSDDSITRLVKKQRLLARQQIFHDVCSRLPTDTIKSFNDMLIRQDSISSLEFLKKAPYNASSSAILNLNSRLNIIKNTGVLSVDLSIVNNNYQKIFCKTITIYSIDRIRKLEYSYRYTALAYFCHQIYKDTIDFLIDTYIKLLNKSYNKAKKDIEEQIKIQEKNIRKLIQTHHKLKAIISDKTISDSDLRKVIFAKFPEEFASNSDAVEIMLENKSVSIFKAIIKKHSYYRQFSPYIIANLDFEYKDNKNDIHESINLIKSLNENNSRKIDHNIPINFVSKKLRPQVKNNDKVDKKAWECALLFAIKREILGSNIIIANSKRFCQFENIFMPEEKWQTIKEEFFSKTKLPFDKDEAMDYLRNRLNTAYAKYTKSGKSYAKVIDDQLVLSKDSTNKLSELEKKKLEEIKSWLSKNMRNIRLPDLLIEVNNVLNFTSAFTLHNRKETEQIEDICAIIVTIMAHGCNIGMYNMSLLVSDISYNQLKTITDWQLTDDAQRLVLSWIVNAISKLELSKKWGDGSTSSSDAHLVSFHEKVLSQSYSPRFRDFALAFYTFVADNYAPFYSQTIECNEGEASYALDGIINNESDLEIKEHYTDTRAASIITFVGFEFLGIKYNPRIRGIQKHKLYIINAERDYGKLNNLVKKKRNKIDMSLIKDQWEKLGHFYASISLGHVSASVGLKRLLALPGRNAFLKANVELGRILKTESTLYNLVNEEERKKRNRGLLKGEEMHQLAREVSYGNNGKITARDLVSQRNCCNCLTIIMACIIYWQAKEIARVLEEKDLPDSIKNNLDLLEHISPIGWENVIIYGEYTIDRKLIKRKSVL